MKRQIIILILISYQVVVSSLSRTHDRVALSLTAKKFLVLIEIDIENMSIEHPYEINQNRPYVRMHVKSKSSHSSSILVLQSQLASLS